jgi:hypothetical protein
MDSGIVDSFNNEKYLGYYFLHDCIKIDLGINNI